MDVDLHEAAIEIAETESSSLVDGTCHSPMLPALNPTGPIVAGTTSAATTGAGAVE